MIKLKFRSNISISITIGERLLYLKFDGVYKLSTRIALIPSGILHE